jgi:dTDP-4-dehydrorhamnose reductase
MRILVTGAGGQLGADVVELLAADPAMESIAADHTALRVEDREAVRAVFSSAGPDVVIHCAALTDVDRCELEPGLAGAVNAQGTANVAEAAAAVGAHVVYVSTDYVFDGEGRRPYVETDPTNPVSVYGATKLAGERACPPGATVVRTSWLSGAHGANFVTTVLRLAEQPGELRFVDDQTGSPTHTADLARALVALALDRRPGCFHVANGGGTSRFALAREILAQSGGDPGRVSPIPTAELAPPRPAVRPAYSVLDTAAYERAGYEPLPSWQDGLAELLGRLRAQR